MTMPSLSNHAREACAFADDLMNWLNALDSSEMEAKDVRSAVCHWALEYRGSQPPAPSEGDVERVLPPFEDEWAKKEAEGYIYGGDALENVKFGYEIARAALSSLRDRNDVLEGDWVETILRYGGRCRDCADGNGICEGSGLPCEPDEARKAIRHVLAARAYYVEHPEFLRPAAAIRSLKQGEGG